MVEASGDVLLVLVWGFVGFLHTEAVASIKQVPNFSKLWCTKGLKLHSKTLHAESAWLSPGAALCCPSSRWFSISIHLLLLSPTNKPSFLLSSLQPRKPSTLHPTQPHLPLALLDFSFCLLNMPPPTSQTSLFDYVCLRPTRQILPWAAFKGAWPAGQWRRFCPSALPWWDLP